MNLICKLTDNDIGEQYIEVEKLEKTIKLIDIANRIDARFVKMESWNDRIYK